MTSSNKGGASPIGEPSPIIQPPSNDTSSDALTQSSEEAKARILEIVNNPSKPNPEEIPGILTIKTASRWMEEAASRPNPNPLWLSLWNEGEVCVLFADSNVGKSIYAVEIANHVAQTQKVLYMDFELSDKQFQLRYTDEWGEVKHFPDNFLRAEQDPYSLGAGEVEDYIFDEIERVAIAYNTNVVIVDNLSYLCNESEKGNAAGIMMQELVALKKKYGWSLLVLAHTPKRSLSSPITQNDLAGSKRIYNFADSVFAIGKSVKDESLRYIKQIKTRAGAFEYGAENVIVSEIVKDGSWLHFRTIGCGREKDHLQEPSDSDRETEEQNIRQLLSDGRSIREVADTLGVSKWKVEKVKKNLKSQIDPIPL